MSEHNWRFVQRAKGGPELSTCSDFGCGAIQIRRWENDNWKVTTHGNGDMVIEAPDTATEQ